jgi:hypothetical protein
MMLVVVLAAPVYAYTPIYSEAEIEAAIDKGLEWLAEQQQADGRWNDTTRNYPVAQTGLAVLKFETHATFMGMNPLDPAYEYSDNIVAGLEYIFSRSFNVTMSVQPAGDPDTNGNGVGITAYSSNTGHEMYEVGIALMAVCGSNSPSAIVGGGSQAGRTYADVAQDMVDFIAFAQVDVNTASRGGWRYSRNYGSSDNSISGYVTLGLAYAEAPAPWGFGAVVTIPSFVFDELALFVAAVQDPVNGDGDDGGSWYVPASWPWVNILKTGNLLSELSLVGQGPGSSNVTNAIDYIERHWDDANTDPGWRTHYQACFTMMKGLQAQGIETLDTGAGPENWYREVADVIVGSQNADGSWPANVYGGPTKSTAWAMLTLEKAAPPALALVPPFDINQVGDQHTVTATYKRAGQAVENEEIQFEIISGPNDDEPMYSDNTNASGEATFTYTGDGGPGTDIIKATAVQSGLSAQVTKIWEEGEIPVEVGGEVYPVNKLAVLAPWIALAAAIMVSVSIVVRQRRAQS